MIPPIVDTSWLQAHMDRDDVVLCDVRSATAGGSPLEDHLAGHLPGARFVSVDDDLAGAPGPVVGRHPLPSPEAFAGALGALGIGDDATVVAYDDRGGAHASRLVWMLRVLGQDAALLDGGLHAWTGPLERGPVDVVPVERRVVPWPSDALTDADAVATHIERGGVVIDSRTHERYLGLVEPLDAVPGHIPGAVNLPFTDNLHDGWFRTTDELARRFETLHPDPDAIAYCGSGVTACHNALAMELAGLPRPRVYVGSWSGWSTDPARPVAADR